MWTSRLAKNLEECRQAKHGRFKTPGCKGLKTCGHSLCVVLLGVLGSLSQNYGTQYQITLSTAKIAYRRLHCAPYSLIRYYLKKKKKQGGGEIISLCLVVSNKVHSLTIDSFNSYARGALRVESGHALQTEIHKDKIPLKWGWISEKTLEYLTYNLVNKDWI